MDLSDLVFSQKKCSEAIGIQPQNFLRLDVEHIRMNGREKLYRLTDVIAAWKKAQRKDQSALDEARTKLAKAQTAKLRIEKKLKDAELKKLQGTLTETKEIEPGLDRAMMIFRSRVLQLHETVTDVEEREEVRSAAIEALKELSENFLDLYNGDDDG